MVPEGTPSQLRIAATATLEPLKPHDWTQVTGGVSLGIWGIYMIYLLRFWFWGLPKISITRVDFNDHEKHTHVSAGQYL